jgi:hypothetical protein
MNDDIQFQNIESWRGGSSGKFGLTFKQIVLMHINRCVVNGSVEWHGGYWNETGNNPVTRTYVHNSRDVYSNSVRMLRALLLGYFDKQTKEADEELDNEFKEKFKEYSEREEKGKDIKYEWYNYKVEWHIRLFEQLIKLSKKLNFFEEEANEEEQ